MRITAEDLLRRGAERHRAGDIAGAEGFYRRAMRLAPGHPDAENLLGVAARQRGDLRVALDHAARAVAAMPDSPLFLSNQGAALAEAGQLGPAIAVMQRVLEMRPDDAVTLRNLGQALTAAGEAQAALAPLREAVRLAPLPEVWLALAHALKEAGERDEAREAARRVSGPLSAQAGFLLAALGEGEAPPRAPAAYVRELFDAFAPRFDAELEGALGYRTPALLAAMLEGRKPGRVLDLGCGTGLSGLALKPFATRLEGLDLSPRMLAEARGRGIYDALHEADLLEFLPKRPAAWDVVAAADVLNYLGDLAPAFCAIRKALRPGGTAVFSLERGEAPVALHEGMRFRHNPDHAARLAEKAGLRVEERRDAALRQEKGVEVAGVLFRMRR
ncbi:methyltransferase domain-containing protein [Sabulicella rubraurantiaca]|uniref:methyltransferase domain-containing protein n=1 Tax=Sabulicella rubraurantiaca TaxID=2811429 RepID=UPI001A97A942|nr:methyltransferase domain-containing protein [Sabulicella rubraurantiaca]